MDSPIEQLRILTIGSIERVRAQSLIVSLLVDSPQATALNSGTPIGFSAH